MDIRTFAVAVQMEEIGHRVKLDIERMATMAEFDSQMCFADEEDAEKQFESAARKLREAGELFASGLADFMLAYSKLGTATKEDREVLNGYARKFLK